MKKKITATIIIFIIISISLYVYYSYTRSTRNSIDKLVSKNKMINILVTGKNSNKNNKYSFFSIFSINPENYNIGITILPHNFRIRLDNEGKKFGKIGELNFNNFIKTQTIRTLLIDLKLHVPFYIECTSDGIKNIVNLLSGVTIYNTGQLKSIYGTTKGLNYLDGKKIITYINSVKDNVARLKYDRILDIIFTLYNNKKKIESSNKTEILMHFIKHINTNLLPQEFLRLGELAAKPGDLYSTVVPGKEINGFYVTDSIAYKIYKKDFLAPLVLKQPIIPKIKILNATKIPRLARKLRNSLIRDGLNVVEFGTFNQFKLKRSIIISKKGNTSAANKVAKTVGIHNIYYNIDNTQLSNVLILIGEDQKK